MSLCVHVFTFSLWTWNEEVSVRQQSVGVCLGLFRTVWAESPAVTDGVEEATATGSTGVAAGSVRRAVLCNSSTPTNRQCGHQLQLLKRGGWRGRGLEGPRREKERKEKVEREKEIGRASCRERV